MNLYFKGITLSEFQPKTKELGSNTHRKNPREKQTLHMYVTISLLLWFNNRKAAPLELCIYNQIHNV